MPYRAARFGDAGWSSPVARQAHNLKVVGSNPAPATTDSRDIAELRSPASGRAVSFVLSTAKLSISTVSSRRCRRDLVSALPLSRQGDGFPIALALGHHRPGHARDLVGERDRRDFRRSTLEQLGKPRTMFDAVDLGVADHGQRAGAS